MFFPAVVLRERVLGFEALRRSVRLVRGFFWRNLNAFLVVYLPMYLLGESVRWIEYDLPEWMGLSRDSGEGLSSPSLCEECHNVMTWLLSEIEYGVLSVVGVTLSLKF